MAGWNAWAPLGAQLAGDGPLVVHNTDGRLELFGTTSGALGPELSHAWQTSPNNGWSAWASLGAPAAQFLGAIAAAVNADGRVEAFGRVGLMGSGGLWHNWQTSPGGGWAGWSSLSAPPGVTLSGVAVGINADGRLEVFTTGQNALWQIGR